jgi:hypothetical protein
VQPLVLRATSAAKRWPSCTGLESGVPKIIPSVPTGSQRCSTGGDIEKFIAVEILIVLEHAPNGVQQFTMTQSSAAKRSWKPF